MTQSETLSVEEARSRILDNVRPLEPERRRLIDALNLVLAEDVYAPFDVPPLANSAMDGYALKAEDIRSATPNSPVFLRLTGMVAAGHMPVGEVTDGTSMRIMTGAVIPPGADTVVPFEDTDEVEQRSEGTASAQLRKIGIRAALGLGWNVRPAGEDVRSGALVLPKNTVLRPAHLGVLASLGLQTAWVIRPPVVAILATGDELREPGEPLQPGQIYNSNSYATAAQVVASGGIPLVLPIARDTLDDLTDKMRKGLAADFFITSAGVSTGEYDLVKDVLTQRGAMHFWRVRMRPGRPLAFGVLQRSDGSLVPHLGLPGNPVSSMVAFDQFARPALLKMQGKPANQRPVVQATLREAVANPDGRRFYARAFVTRTANGGYQAKLSGPQGSNILTALALANGLVIVPEDCTAVAAGQQVDVQLLEGYEDLFS